MNVILTELGRQIIRLFNLAYVYARCGTCGQLAAPPRDGYMYACVMPNCQGILYAIDPRSLA